MDNFIGKQLDERYIVDELIGAGGMANVYKARDKVENRVVAIKVLKEECMSNIELVRRFKNESKAIAVLDHANIVKVYDVSVSDQLQFIVMECVEGITLKEYMEYRKGSLTDKEVVHFISQVLSALQHAHQKGIVHRDIKPQNIMLLANGNIKVMDFGIARFSRSENQTMTDKAIGSVHYISPEQAKGETTDFKADLYSVGVMMYEMLAGRLPFEADSPVAVALKQISDVATPLRTINPNIPQGLQSITEHAMAKDPRERYQSAGAMLADLQAFTRNPNITFDYTYTIDTNETIMMDKVVEKPVPKKQEPKKTPAPRKRTPQAKPAQRTRTRKKKSIFIPILLGITLAFAIGAAILVYMIFEASNAFFFSDRVDVELPNFYHMTQAEVKSNSYYMDTFNITFEELYNAEQEAGVIYDQSPKAPKTVKEGAAITLRVSKGTEMVLVPEVTGWDRDEAVEKIKEANLNVMIKPEVSETVEEGKVIRTEAAGGTQVATNETIVVYISQPERITEEFSTPDCIGLSKEDALELLSKNFLIVGSFTEVDNTLPAGTIIGQTPDAGTVVPRGTPVYLQVSLGHTHVFEPSDIIIPATCQGTMVTGEDGLNYWVGKRWYRCSCGLAEEREYRVEISSPEGHNYSPDHKHCLWGCGFENPNYVEPTPAPAPDPVTP